MDRNLGISMECMTGTYGSRGDPGVGIGRLSDNEVSLRMAWVRDMLVKLLGSEVLVTTGGYVVVEIGLLIDFDEAGDILAMPCRLAELKTRLAPNRTWP